MKRIKNAQEREFAKALYKIANMGVGIKEEIRDWSNIGRNAIFVAREALAGNCKECGRPKPFKAGSEPESK